MAMATASPLAMTDGQRADLETMARSRSLAHRKVVLAKALLLAADGVGTNEAARRCDTSDVSAARLASTVQNGGCGGGRAVCVGMGTQVVPPRGHHCCRSTRHLARQARRRFDTLDDKAHGRAFRDRQGHRGSNLAGPQLETLEDRDLQALGRPDFEEKLVDLHVPEHLDVDVVLDNLSAHKAPAVTEWLAHPKRARHLHFTPTSFSWLNLVERFFNELTQRRLPRGVFTSVSQLVQLAADADPGSLDPFHLLEEH